MTALPAIDAMRRALYRDAGGARAAVLDAFAPGAMVRLGAPFGALEGGAGLWDGALAPLLAAWPDLERRDHIAITGEDGQDGLWAGCCGYYCGTFAQPFLGIPPTGQVAHMRYHEFFRIDDGKVVEMQAIWDIPEVMLQAGVWPLAPSLGREWHVPGPATGDGLGPHDAARSDAARAHVIAMLEHMLRHPAEGGPEVMQLDRFWHPRFMWYGPSGIGTARGVDGFRRHHQIPFLNAMPDRGAREADLTSHFFAEGDYVAVTGWPNMRQTHAQGGWLGLPPTGKVIDLRSLDFWRLEDGLIRENWVLVDLLHVYDQLGVDVFARMKELGPWTSASA